MAKPLKKVSNAYWVYYVNEAEAKKFDDSKVRKSARCTSTILARMAACRLSHIRTRSTL